MPKSTPPSSFDARRACGRRRLPADAGVSEIVGAMLIFGILSILLVLAMLGFREAESGVHDRAVALQAEATADRVAGVIVQASLFAEEQDDGALLRYSLDLPDQLEGRDYVVRTESEDTLAGTPERVVVLVPATAAEEAAVLFSAGAPEGFRICDSEVAGGSIWVRYGPDPADPNDPLLEPCLFLEEA